MLDNPLGRTSVSHFRSPSSLCVNVPFILSSRYGVRLCQQPDGVEVLAVAVNSEAAHKGVQICDRLLSVNGKSMRNASLETALSTILAL